MAAGVRGEYLGRLYMESKHRPLFIIENVTRYPVATPEKAVLGQNG